MRLVLLIVNLIVFSLLFVGILPAQQGNYTHQVFDNGLTVIIKHNPDSRVFAIDILGKNRALHEYPDKAGITDLMHRMLKKGSEEKNAEQIQEALDDIGAKFSANDNPYIPYDDRYTWRAFSFIRFETIDEYAEDGVKILHEIVTQPSFPESELAEVKNKVMGILGMNSSSTYKNCRNLYYDEIFKNHPLSTEVLGGHRSVGMITTDDLRQFHARYYAPGNLIMTVVSNHEPKKVLKWLKKRFGKLPAQKTATGDFPKVTARTGVTDVNALMVKEQVYIYLGNLLPGINSEDAMALRLATTILSSRLRLNLREKQGLAYSVGAGIRFLKDFGWYTCSMGTGYENYEIARDGILDEIRKLSTEPLPDEELEKTKNSLWGSMLMRNLSCINQAYNMAYYEYVGAGYDYDETYREKLEMVTAEQVRQVAAKYFDTDNYVQAYVGKVGSAEPSE